MPTIISSTIDKALTDWIKAELPEGSNVIWAMQSSEGDTLGSLANSGNVFATLNLSTPPSIRKGTKELIPTVNVGEFEIQYISDFTLSVNLYGGYSVYVLAEKIKTSLAVLSTKEQLRSAGLGVRMWSDTNDLSEVVNNKWEVRTQFDVLFSYITKRIDQPSEINSVQFDGQGIFDQLVVEK